MSEVIRLLLLLLSSLFPVESKPVVELRPYAWFAEAGVPEHLWPEYLIVAACESGMNPRNGRGDGGAAKGLFQIHWHLWQPWATRIDPAWSTADWRNPAHNAALTYLIQEKYSLPRGAERWDQWSAKPDWALCVARAENWLLEQ